MSIPMRWTALMPLRDLGGGKTRLATVLSSGERESLTRHAASAVVAACQAAPLVDRVVVVSGSHQASDWARSVGAEAWEQPKHVRGLSNAMEAAARVHAEPGRGLVLVMGDLPRATAPALQRCLERSSGSGLTLVPSRSGTGTNLLAFPQGALIALSLGAADSLSRHRLAARQAGLTVRTVRSAPLALDVDEAEDLALLARIPAAMAALPFLTRF